LGRWAKYTQPLAMRTWQRGQMDQGDRSPEGSPGDPPGVLFVSFI
jgi:hypothetical protein